MPGISRVILTGLTITLAFAVYQRAGVLPSDWNKVLLGIGLLAAIHFAFARKRKLPMLDRLPAIAGAALLAIAVLQVLPLPIALVRALSPARAALLDALPNAAGSAPRFASLSIVPYESAQYVLTLAGVILVFLLLRDLTMRSALGGTTNPWRNAWPLIIVATLEAIMGLYQAAEGAASNPNVTGTYANRDHFAGLIEMVLPFAAIYPFALLQRDERGTPPPWFVMPIAGGILVTAALLLAAIVQSLSRMAFLASLAALFVSGTLMLFYRRERRADQPASSRRSRSWLWRLLPAASIAGVLAIAGLIFFPNAQLLGRFSELASTDGVNSDARAQIWRESVEIVKTYPWFGCGLGGFQSAYFRFKNVAPMETVDYAHNDYLQVLTELGVFGFIAGVVLMGGILQRVIAAISSSLATPGERHLAIACFASMLAMLLHSLVDFNMYVPANSLVFAWVAGMASGLSDCERAITKRAKGNIHSSSTATA